MLDNSSEVSAFEDSSVSSSSAENSDNMETVDEELKVLKRQLEENTNSEKEKEPKPKRKRTKPLPGTPKRPRTAYMYYLSHIRPSVKEEFPTEGFAEISKIIGAKWATLTEEDKVPFQTQAAADHKRWEEEKKNFTPTKTSESHSSKKSAKNKRSPKITKPTEPPKHPGIAGKSPRHMAIPIPAPPEESEPKIPRRSKKRKTPDVKKGITPYNAFVTEKRAQIKQKLREENPDISETDVTRQVAEAWRKLSPTEKEGYTLISKQDIDKKQRKKKGR